MVNLLKILTKADNIPILGLLIAVVFFTLYGLRLALAQDRGRGVLYPNPRDSLHTWPFLVRLEFLCIILALVFLTVWSIGIDAPLEDAANPAKTPNPSKAPWYFLGLQEMLVYFDPWIAGVVLPLFIILGLMAIPYLDPNPRGNGYFTLKQRPFAILTFLFGFLFLWISLIMVGTFLRGPGWNFFAPWQRWDVHKVVAITNVDLPYLVGEWLKIDFLKASPLVQGLFGGVVVGGYYLLGMGLPYLYLKRLKRSQAVKTLGFWRYLMVSFLFLTMMGLPMKMVLRWFLNVKYIWITPWFNV